MEAVGERRHAGHVRAPAVLLRVAPDARLVDLVRQGSEPAFEVLFDRHHRPLLSFCRHMLGSQAEAEDAVQQTFLSAYRSLLDSDRPVVVRPWLYAIARNRCLSMLRARHEVAEEEVDARTAVEGLSAEVARREDLREMLADLQSLPDEQRAALLLAELEDLSHAEIAGVLGCRKDRVKALIFQAREALAGTRDARAIPCQEIREQLATATGGVLRRAPLRRHLAVCDGCRAFRQQVTHQRASLALVLPVAPSVALKAGALPWTAGAGAGGAGGAALGGGAAGTATTAAGTGGSAAATAVVGVATTGGTGAALGGVTLAKVLAVGVLATGGAAGGIAAVDAGHSGSTPSSTPASSSLIVTSRPAGQSTMTPVSTLALMPGAVATAPGRSAASAGNGKGAGATTASPGHASGHGTATAPGQTGTHPGRGGSGSASGQGHAKTGGPGAAAGSGPGTAAHGLAKTPQGKAQGTAKPTSPAPSPQGPAAGAKGSGSTRKDSAPAAAPQAAAPAKEPGSAGQAKGRGRDVTSASDAP